ncbi:MAG: Glutamate-1-semialdehyde 2,1-aminomutase [Chlamydiae bacterium]|nr:Glutamate-1-semialdehyde 2,1-aminomutase [Chlamydiota bacterium]
MTTVVTSVPLERKKSREVYVRSCQVIPKGVNSPVRAFPGLSQTPLVVASGQGETIVDVDGYEYVDFCQSWGALIHGHAHPKIVAAAQERVAQGSTFGITTEIEAELASEIVSCIPSVEKVRFVSSGTEATMSAIRLARGFTGRDFIVKFSGHYHGHADPFLVQAGSGLLEMGATSSSAGVPEECVRHTICLPFNDFAVAEKLFKEMGEKIAAVILEPVPANMGVVFPKEGFLTFLREQTEKVGALLIFDEVISGFRVALGGAQELYGVTPDLTCFGKIIGGGFPAAAFGGRGDVMEMLAPLGPVYQAGTLSGNPVAMAAGFEALKLCQEPHFYENLEKRTNLLTRPLQEWIERSGAPLCLNQIGSLFTLFFGKREVETLDDVKGCDFKAFARAFQSLFQQGIYFSPSPFEAQFVSGVHTEETMERTLEALLSHLD